MAPCITLLTVNLFDVVVHDQGDDVFEDAESLVALSSLRAIALPMKPPMTAKAMTGTDTINTTRRARDFIEDS